MKKKALFTLTALASFAAMAGPSGANDLCLIPCGNGIKQIGISDDTGGAELGGGQGSKVLASDAKQDHMYFGYDGDGKDVIPITQGTSGSTTIGGAVAMAT